MSHSVGLFVYFFVMFSEIYLIKSAYVRIKLFGAVQVLPKTCLLVVGAAIFILFLSNLSYERS